jgi:hypothetical protein
LLKEVSTATTRHEAVGKKIPGVEKVVGVAAQPVFV